MIPRECALRRVDGILCMTRFKIERPEVAGSVSFSVAWHRVGVVLHSTGLVLFYVVCHRVNAAGLVLFCVAWHRVNVAALVSFCMVCHRVDVTGSALFSAARRRVDVTGFVSFSMARHRNFMLHGVVAG